MSNIAKIISTLSQPVPKDKIKKFNKGKTELDYLQWTYVTTKLNEVCPGWQSKTDIQVIGNEVFIKFDLGIPDENGILVWRSDVWGEPLGKQGFGGSITVAKQHAFKRAAANFGLGIELYDKDKESFESTYKSPAGKTTSVNLGQQINQIKKLMVERELPMSSVDFSKLTVESATAKIKELGG